MKRITYLTKRSDLNIQEFRAHWATTHAEIARDLPGVLSYKQNHVLAKSAGADLYGFDGIVELWFKDVKSFNAGFGSDVADRLIIDEKKFLSGLTGAAVHSGKVTPCWPGKLWMLARFSDESGTSSFDEGLLSEKFTELVAHLKVVGLQTNKLDSEAAPLRRETLKFDEQMPQLAVSFGFSSASDAIAAFEKSSQISLHDFDLCLDRVQWFFVEELQVT